MKFLSFFSALSLLVSPVASADTPLTVVVGRAIGHFSIAAEIPCPKDDICMDAWIGWAIEAKDVLAGAPAKGRIRAARIQHAWFVPGYLRRFKLFVLQPIEDPAMRKLLTADYFLRDVSESTSVFCTHERPEVLGIEAESVFVEQGAASPRHCFVPKRAEEDGTH